MLYKSVSNKKGGLIIFKKACKKLCSLRLLRRAGVDKAIIF